MPRVKFVSHLFQIQIKSLHPQPKNLYKNKKIKKRRLGDLIMTESHPDQGPNLFGIERK